LEEKSMDKKRAILCVDDEALMLMALTRELRRRFKDRFLYEQATSAEAGLKAIDELLREDIQVIIIISDWLMPGMKGDEFLEEVNVRHPGIKEIMITGQADAEALERLKKNPALIAVFPKPWSSEELFALIEESATMD
jgi:DNA-binding NtrC family response regulator